ADAGNVAEAFALYDRALAAEPGNTQLRLNRAVLHLLTGNLAAGWQDYAARLAIANKVPAPDHNLPRWNGESLAGQRLLVTGEQGVGDQIMFASMLGELSARASREGGALLLDCEPRLVSLFARSFPQMVVRAWDIESSGGVTRTRYSWLQAGGGATAAIEMGS